MFAFHTWSWTTIHFVSMSGADQRILGWKWIYFHPVFDVEFVLFCSIRSRSFFLFLAPLNDFRWWGISRNSKMFDALFAVWKIKFSFWFLHKFNNQFENVFNEWNALEQMFRLLFWQKRMLFNGFVSIKHSRGVSNCELVIVTVFKYIILICQYAASSGCDSQMSANKHRRRQHQ